MATPLNYSGPPGAPQQQLRGLRLIWVGLIGGQIAFFAAATFLSSQLSFTVDAQIASILAYVSLAFGLVLVPAAFVVRGKIFASERPIPMRKYMTGNIAFYAMMEGPSFIGLVAYLLGAPSAIALIMPAISVGLQAINFPTGNDADLNE